MDQLEQRVYGLECEVKFLLNAHNDLVAQQLRIIRHLDYLCDCINENLDDIVQKINTMDPTENDWTNLL